jgi:DNA-binding transcriptional LysR family regulator
VSLAQLRYFVAVAEDGHVGRAAERLHMAQPPLSRQIRSLEDELGVALFRRTPRGMELLPPGEVLLERARTALAFLDRTVDDVRGLRKREGGPAPGS